MTITLFLSLPQWQSARANVMENQTGLIKLPNTRVSVAAENGSIKVLNGVGSFIIISPQDRNLRNAIQKRNQHAYR